MHMLHLHRFERHDSLTGRDTLALLHQHRDDAAVHGGTDLAVAATSRSALGRSQCAIANRMGRTAMQEPEPVAVAKIFGVLDDGAVLEANYARVDLLDREAILSFTVADSITALAIAQQFELMRRPIDFDTQWNWKCRSQR